MSNKKSTTLGFFEKLINENYQSQIESEFHELEHNNLRDVTKEYDENEQVYYLLKEDPETLDVMEESYPISFKKWLKNVLNLEFKKVIDRLEEQVEEIPRVDAMLKFIEVQFRKINELIAIAEEKEELPEHQLICKMLHIIKNEILAIKLIYSDELGSERDESNTTSGYGIHQGNEEWIRDTFPTVEQQQPSQNQTVLKVKELYQEEFGFSIGKTTILRAVGRTD